ncbi:amino acid ABC transporter permease [Kitasatospora sp. NA04385]|uniref:amino acid ABC transporter permease n=1 Tax=Kitasatospora sp. NA04385 TaxID=2742135 RepID=UPI00158FE10B|nr:amino acid ABC transporter permease [Kitasatospora sp. NA04385]QKW21531.1 amino acid ABC transporter permease [Kitasatospora sp. NA04385]
MASPAAPSAGLRSAAPPPADPPADAPADPAAASTAPPVLPIVPRRRPGRYVSGGLALLATALLVRSLAGNPAFEWPVVGSYLTAPSILRGLLLTLWLTGAVMALGFALGTALAVARLSGNPVLGALGWGFVWIFRATPLLVQLLFWFNIGALYPTLSLSLPFGGELFAVKTVNLLGPVLTALIGLTLHEAAFAAEVVRSGVQSVDQGQLEAAASLGLGRGRVLRRIVLPQAMPAILPPAGNMLIGTLKGTAVISVLAVHDLLFSAQVIYNQTYQVIPLLTVATVWYVVVTSVLSVGQYYLERHFARGTTRAGLPPTPWQRARALLGRLPSRRAAGR